MSPYLFIICAEALTSLLTKAEAKGSITSVPIREVLCESTTSFFTYDNLLIFCKANSLEWSRMLHIMGIYERASGQVLSMRKKY